MKYNVENRACRGCLLEEMGETLYFESVKKYRKWLPENEKVTEQQYARRLNECKQCSALVQATCNICGCYVEIRAARKGSKCPLSVPRW